MRTARLKLQLKDVLIGDRVIMKDDPKRRVFEVRESTYEGYIDLWRGKHRVITAAPSQEIEFVTT